MRIFTSFASHFTPAPSPHGLEPSSSPRLLARPHLLEAFPDPVLCPPFRVSAVLGLCLNSSAAQCLELPETVSSHLTVSACSLNARGSPNPAPNRDLASSLRARARLTLLLYGRGAAELFEAVDTAKLATFPLWLRCPEAPRVPGLSRGSLRGASQRQTPPKQWEKWSDSGCVLRAAPTDGSCGVRQRGESG